MCSYRAHSYPMALWSHQKINILHVSLWLTRRGSASTVQGVHGSTHTLFRLQSIHSSSCSPHPPPSTFFCLEESRRKGLSSRKNTFLEERPNRGLIKRLDGEVCVQNVLLRLWSPNVHSPFWRPSSVKTQPLHLPFLNDMYLYYEKPWIKNIIDIS